MDPTYRARKHDDARRLLDTDGGQVSERTQDTVPDASPEAAHASTGRVTSGLSHTHASVREHSTRAADAQRDLADTRALLTMTSNAALDSFRLQAAQIKALGEQATVEQRVRAVTTAQLFCALRYWLARVGLPAGLQPPPAPDGREGRTP